MFSVVIEVIVVEGIKRLMLVVSALKKEVFSNAYHQTATPVMALCLPFGVTLMQGAFHKY